MEAQEKFAIADSREQHFNNCFEETRCESKEYTVALGIPDRAPSWLLYTPSVLN